MTQWRRDTWSPPISFPHFVECFSRAFFVCFPLFYTMKRRQHRTRAPWGSIRTRSVSNLCPSLYLSDYSISLTVCNLMKPSGIIFKTSMSMLSILRSLFDHAISLSFLFIRWNLRESFGNFLKTNMPLQSEKQRCVPVGRNEWGGRSEFRQKSDFRCKVYPLFISFKNGSYFIRVCRL